MPSLAGVIYPNAFAQTNLIRSISPTFSHCPSSQPFRTFNYKNIEIGSWNLQMNSNCKKSIWTTLYGSIHNRCQLSKELKDAGFVIENSDDATLAVLAYEAWGAASLFEKIDGPFAIALFDEEKEALYLGIDRMGQKALYWTFQNDHFLFSTEIKGLLASGIVPQVASNTALSSFLFFGFIPQDYSAIEGVNKLVPGHYIKVNLKRAMAIEQYWSLSKSLRHKEPYTPEEATAKLGSLLKENLDSCSQKPKFATHLHDTLGSDIITWLVAHTQPREQVDTYTPIFEEKESTILKGSEQFAKKLSLRHHSKRILVDAALDELPRLVWHLDEPLADPNCLQTWALGRQVKESGATLVLDLGWRELLAGHEYYFANSSKETSIPFAYTLAKIPPFLRDQILFPVLRYTNERLAYRMLRNIRINRDQIGYLAHTALFKEPIRKKAAPQLYPTFDPEVFTQRFHSITAHNDEVHPSLYYDLKTALPNHTLIQYNRLLAPFGVDCEMPFLRNSLLDFAFSLPDSVKFASKEPGSALLSLWNHLTCEKSQYAPPPLMAPSWSNHPRLRTLFTALEKGRLAEEGFISGRWLHEMNQMRDLTDIAFRELWSILILEVWFRLFINRPIAMADHEVKTETLLGC